MPNNAFRLSFIDHSVYVSHTGNGNFNKSSSPTSGSVKVTNAVELTLTANGAGANILNPGDPAKPGRIDFFAALKTRNPTFTKIGELTGTIQLKTGGVPLFDCKSAGKDTFFVPDKGNLIARSDFQLDLQFDQKTVTSVNFPMRLSLPWQFNAAATTMLLGTELFVDGTSVASVAQNKPFDLPMRHTNVPDDGVPNDPTDHPLLTFYGIGRLYARNNAQLGSQKIRFQGHRVRVVLHQSVITRFVGTNVPLQSLVGAIEATLQDAGFGTNVDVQHNAAAQTRANAVFMPINGVPVSVNMQAAHRSSFAASVIAGTGGAGITFQDTEVVNVDFFDFFVYAVSGDPSGDELGRSEMLLPITGSTHGGIVGAGGRNPQKALLKAIEICVGSSTTGVGGALAKIITTDHVNLVASTICHEIGHSFGLRHSLSFDSGNTKYTINPPKGKTSKGVMGPGSIVLGASNVGPFPAEFFGPVHVSVIRDQFL